MSGSRVLILLTNIVGPPKGLFVGPNLNLTEHLINTSEIGESHETKILTCSSM